MRTVLATLATLSLATAGGMILWRAADHRADRIEMDRLLSLQPVDPPPFDPVMVAGLPEPARRFFGFAIAPGTPLRRVAEIEMTGQFSLGTKEAPNYMAMRARQTLAAPHGFVWSMRGGDGPLRLWGSDSGSWTRFWMGGVLPVARRGGNPDHRRSAFGRYVAEAVFWTPAALLPGPGIAWKEMAPDVARVVVTHEGLSQSVDVRVDAEGRLLEVAFPRWSDANPEGVHRVQPFGGYLSDFREFDGFRLPTHVEAGNMFGTEDFFPFFVVDATAIRFPPPSRSMQWL